MSIFSAGNCRWDWTDRCWVLTNGFKTDNSRETWQKRTSELQPDHNFEVTICLEILQRCKFRSRILSQTPPCGSGSDPWKSFCCIVKMASVFRVYSWLLSTSSALDVENIWFTNLLSPHIHLFFVSSLFWARGESQFDLLVWPVIEKFVKLSKWWVNLEIIAVSDGLHVDHLRNNNSTVKNRFNHDIRITLAVVQSCLSFGPRGQMEKPVDAGVFCHEIEIFCPSSVCPNSYQ